jgi:hypothetical protein
MPIVRNPYEPGGSQTWRFAYAVPTGYVWQVKTHLTDLVFLVWSGSGPPAPLPPAAGPPPPSPGVPPPTS